MQNQCSGCVFPQDDGSPGEQFVIPVDKDTTGDVVLKITPEDGETPEVTGLKKKICEKTRKSLVSVST